MSPIRGFFYWTLLLLINMAKEVDYQTLSRAYNNLLERVGVNNDTITGSTNQNVTGMTENVSNQSGSGTGTSTSSQSGANGSVEQQPVKSDGAMGDVWIKNFIRSINWKPKKQGFYIDGLTGYAEFSNVFVSGNIQALTGLIGGFTIGATDLYATDGINETIISSGPIAFSAGPIGSPSVTITQAGALTATSGYIAGWEIQPTLLRSASSGSRIELNKGKNRMSIFDDVNEKVVMGYLNGLPKHDGTGYWGAGDYGFWALAGDKLSIDGDGEYVSGDWIVQNDAAYLIKDGFDNTIVRLGTDTGEKGLFIYNTSHVQLAKYISDEIFIGEANKYLQYTVAGGLLIKGNITITNPGDINTSDLNNDAGWTDDSALNTFVSDIYTGEISSLQSQIDGQITTWFYGYIPSLINVPASDWTTDSLKNNHLGDLFYDTVTGYVYRFLVSGGVYSWQQLSDSDIAAALLVASNAQDTADGKRRVFTATPTTPYDVGDLWLTSLSGTTGDLKKCVTAKPSGAYDAADWLVATKYTDDTVANSKTVTFLQDAIPVSLAIGDLWVDTNDSNKLYRAASAGADAIIAGEWILVELAGGAKIFAQDAIPTSLAINDLWYDTNDGNKLYKADSVGATTIGVGQWVAVTTDFANVAGATKPADNATVGATWGVNLGSIPAVLGAPSGTGLFLSSTNMGYYTGGAWKTYMDNAGNLLLGDIAGGNTGMAWDQAGGTLTIKGAITADTGYIGGLTGWVITSNYIKDVAGVTGMSSVVTAGDDIRFWAGHATPASAPFYVTEAGVLVATSATITGTITSTAGTIGGFDIGADYIRDAADSFGMASTVAAGDDIRFWAGDTFANRAIAPFRITESGRLSAIGGAIIGLKAYTIFESDTRFSPGVAGTGVVSFGNQGVLLYTGATGTSYASCLWSATSNVFLGNPIFSVHMKALDLTAASGAASSYFGLGNIGVTGTTHNYNDWHVGFKILKTGGVVSLYATQADGTTETASGALTTLATNDVVDLILKKNGTTSTEYYWRKNTGTISAATVLTTNLPTLSENILQFSVSNNTTSYDLDFQVLSASYER